MEAAHAVALLALDPALFSCPAAGPSGKQLSPAEQYAHSLAWAYTRSPAALQPALLDALLAAAQLDQASSAWGFHRG